MLNKMFFYNMIEITEEQFLKSIAAEIYSDKVEGEIWYEKYLSTLKSEGEQNDVS